MAAVSPSTRIPKRPFYLVLALMGAVMLGMGSCNEGCATIRFYRGTPIEASALTTATMHEEDRTRIHERFDQLGVVRDGAKRRAFPLGIAALLLGGAITVFSWSAISGRPSARNALLQLLVADAVLTVVAFALTKDIQLSENEFYSSLMLAQAHVMPQDDPNVQVIPGVFDRFLVFRSAITLALGLLFRALIVLALTRQKTREYFDAVGALISGR